LVIASRSLAGSAAPLAHVANIRRKQAPGKFWRTRRLPGPNSKKLAEKPDERAQYSGAAPKDQAQNWGEACRTRGMLLANFGLRV
jgi:hypothetical protein